MCEWVERGSVSRRPALMSASSCRNTVRHHLLLSGCSRLAAAGCARYAPNSVGVIVAAVLSGAVAVAGSRGRRVVGFA